jgi:hypothetical protein
MPTTLSVADLQYTVSNVVNAEKVCLQSVECRVTGWCHLKIQSGMGGAVLQAAEVGSVEVASAD